MRLRVSVSVASVRACERADDAETHERTKNSQTTQAMTTKAIAVGKLRYAARRDMISTLSALRALRRATYPASQLAPEVPRVLCG